MTEVVKKHKARPRRCGEPKFSSRPMPMRRPGPMPALPGPTVAAPRPSKTFENDRNAVLFGGYQIQNPKSEIRNLKPLVYLNGRFVPASPTVLPLDDLGFTQGVAITDRLRTFQQRLFRLDDHLRRFRRNCDAAFVPQPRADAELAAAATELIEINAKRLAAGCELSLSIFATPGGAEPTLGMQAEPLHFERNRHIFERGAILEPMPQSNAIDPRIKHRSRLAWWIARHELRSRPEIDPQVEPLLTSGGSENLVRETPIANFLVVVEGELISPPRSEILNGISLQVVEELSAALGIRFREREVGLDEVVSRGMEWLLCNTSFCLASVSRIGAHGCRTGPLDGSIYRQLLRAWSDLVGVDIRQQFFSSRSD
jgi:branched-chain amino acid aminotransferase